MADLLENLNEKQREAVLGTEGYVRVIAGAGSGKTKLLVSRYAYLVQEYGIDSSNILCVTFTNKAAGEMKRRIRALIGDGYDVSLICTYHGFCNRLLRENPEKLFLNKQFQIIDSQQQKAILAEIYQKLELKLDHASFESILRKIGYAKKDGAYVARMCDPQPCQILSEMKEQDDNIIEEFLQRQKATYSLDFHDLIAFAIYLLVNDSEVREKWQNRLNYIMVDEFQDSSAVEMRLVDILSGQYRNLMIVGDPDQNIYEWRGSDVKLLVDFDKSHVPTQTVILNQNYRSTPQILSCANALIEKNQLRLKKDLFTRNAAGAPVIHYHSKTDFEEMEHVIENIKKLRVSQGLRYSDFAIIYRSGFLSRVVEKKLVEKNIPYEIFGGVRFYQRMEILDILAYLKLIAYDDDTSFRRIVNTPRRRFGRAKMNALDTLKEHDDSLFATLSMHLEAKEFQNSDVASFVRFVSGIRNRYQEERISDIVNEVTRESGYEQYIRELGDEERLDNLAEFKRIANEFEREFGEDLSLEGFLQQIALQSGEDRSDQKDTVKLMTIHASKGLEFPVVFILGFTEGIFPSAKTIGERKKLGLEEERRLCYVAITRAERYLFLMESEGTSQNGMQKLVSRFIDEIGEKNYVRIGQLSEDLLQESRCYAAKLDRETGVEQDTQRRPGDVVEHHIFGRGTIEQIDAKRGSYVIRFDKLAQTRSISIRYFAQEHEDIRQKYMAQDSPAGVGKDSEGKEYMNPSDVDGQQMIVTHIERIFDNGNDMQKERQEFTECQSSAVTVDADAMSPMLEDVDRAYDVGTAENVDSGFYNIYVDKDTKAGANTNELSAVKVIECGESYDKVSDTEGVEDTGDDWHIIGGEAGEDDVFGEHTIVEGDALQCMRQNVRRLKENSPNLWKRDDAPHEGWTCVGIEDLGAPVGICEMCGYQIIRYAHHMEHPRYRSLTAGCVCAGRMEGDIEAARRRETEYKNKASRREHFFQKIWKRSKKGNEYLKTEGHVIVLYQIEKAGNKWKYSIDNVSGKSLYPDRDKAAAGVFDALEKLREDSK